MTDPYNVLGISPNASDDEITRAYRKLAKKYHPDLNPGDKAAEQRMREINAAYDDIKNGKHGGASYERTDGTYGPQQQSGGTYSGQDNPFGDFDDIFSQFFGSGWNQNQNSGQPNLNTARQYIQMRQYTQALRILSQIQNRNAEWYYYSAIANAGIGNRITALSHAREAVRMEPNNFEYRSILEQLEKGSSNYRQSGQGYGFNMRNLGRTVLQLLLAQLFCMFCCRPC